MNLLEKTLQALEDNGQGEVRVSHASHTSESLAEVNAVMDFADAHGYPAYATIRSSAPAVDIITLHLGVKI